MAFSMTRRQFLASLAYGWMANSSIARASPLPIESPPATVLGGWRRDGIDYVGVWKYGTEAEGLKVRGRTHEVICDPSTQGVAVAIARRPGHYLCRFDYRRMEILAELEPEMHRIFNGHGAFSSDGQYFYTSEHDLISGAGLIGIRDAITLAKVREISTHGPAPHAMIVEDEGTLLIANGGLGALPSEGEPRMGEADISSALVRITPSGDLKGRWTVPDKQLSIRHLARSHSSRVGVAMQAAHLNPEERNSAPTLAVFDGTNLVPIPGTNFGGYVGDIVGLDGTDRQGFALGCSHSNQVVITDLRGRVLGTTSIARACAVGVAGSRVLALTERGALAYIDGASALVEENKLAVEWENHMTVV